MRILYLDLDTLRPDHLGCYGYRRGTSPALDRIAARGLRFDRYYCSDAPCLPSRAALMSGRFGIHTGVVGHGGTCADLRIEGARRGFQDGLRTTSLPATLKQAGLRTAFIGGFAERHSSWTFYAGFREIHDTGLGGAESAEHVTPSVLDWLARHGRKDQWYLHVNYWDPHTPYRAPPEFGNPFENAPLPDWFSEDLIARHRALAGPHGAQEINMYDNQTQPRFPRHLGEVKDMRDLRRFIDGYDCGIRYMDDHIARLLAALEEQGVLEDTAIIVSSDHGENLGELGLYAEHATADHVTCRIPMIVAWPGGARGGTDAGLHYNIDLLPTLAELLGQEAKTEWDGRSFAAAVRDGQACGRDDLVISQCAHVCQRGVRWGPYLYMRTYHDGFHLFPQEMIFDVDNDPHEQKDLAPARPDLCREGAWRLAAWHDRMMLTMPEGYDTDPLWTVMREGGPYHARGRLREYTARLKATGRAAAAEELKRRHPREWR